MVTMINEWGRKADAGLSESRNWSGIEFLGTRESSSITGQNLSTKICEKEILKNDTNESYVIFLGAKKKNVLFTKPQSEYWKI